MNGPAAVRPPFPEPAPGGGNRERLLACQRTGYRHHASGALTNVGNNGFSWSSTVSGINGLDLNFNSQNLNPGNANNRAYGFQVRCLQAFTGTLIFYFSD